jgi:hypothetical protein
MVKRTWVFVAMVALVSATLFPDGSNAGQLQPSYRAALAAGVGGVARIEITRRESFANGTAFGQTGPYEKLVGIAYLELDPADPHNAAIFDLDKTPRNARGMVEASTDLYILKPVDMALGNRKIFFEVNNRGNKQSLGTLNDGPGGANANDPTTPEDAGNGFLMREGYTVVWAGWQGDVTRGGNRMTISIPTATDGGAEITGPVVSQFDAGRQLPNDGMVQVPLSGRPDFDPYETASLDTSTARLTMRDLIDSPETVIPGTQWAFATCERNAATGTIENLTPSSKHLCLFEGFDRNKLYQIVYTGKNPRPMGVGYAATRDVLAFLRYAEADSAGTSNPLGTSISQAHCHGSSQSAMYVRDFIYLGFNETLDGRKVCDGAMYAIPGARRLHLSTRFTQPEITSGQDTWASLTPVITFPFSYAVTTDPLSGRTDGILKRPSTDPLIIHLDSETEYWQYGGSLVSHDGLGRSVTLPDTVRYFLMSSAQHGSGGTPQRGICEQLSNPLSQNAFRRAMLIALDQWVAQGVAPPDSQYPQADDGTLVLPDRESTGFPVLPGITYHGKVNTAVLADFGPGLTSTGGVISIMPPILPPGPAYRMLVPKVNADGLNVAGLRRPDDVQTPLATQTGWGSRAPGFRAGDSCGQPGMYLPFAKTEAERAANGDPRPSIEARYPSQNDYALRVRAAATEMVVTRQILQEDADRIIAAAEERDILK